MSGWTMAWLIWGLMFVAVEGVALVRRTPGATLSEHLQAFFAVRDKPWGWRGRRAALVAALAALAAHLVGWF